MSKKLQDNILLESAQKGDREAFRKLVNENSRRLYSLAWRIVGNEQLAEDVVQESFIKAYKQLSNFDGRSTVSTWLYRITTNTAIDMKRKMTRQHTVSLHCEDNGADMEIIDNQSSPESHQQQVSLKKQMQKAMEELTTQERTAFTLKHHDGRSIDEISHILQLSENSVKQAIFRSVKKLRLSLNSLFEESNTIEMTGGTFK